jgi:hypothetical protein
VKPYATNRPVDWMNLTPSDWMDRYVPGWRQSSYGDLLRTKPTDWLGWINPQYAGAVGAFARHPSSDVLRHDRIHPRGCRCRDCVERECGHCGPEPCECVCCIGDVDLVVYARVGELRVIPIVVENSRRREKSVTVELSGWRTRGGGVAPVDTVSVEPKAFTLAPCGMHEVTIAARVRPPEPAGETRTPDVDGCLVVTADLTLVGCDHRPIRIAIAILPRDCDPLRICCGCGCC